MMHRDAEPELRKAPEGKGFRDDPDLDRHAQEPARESSEARRVAAMDRLRQKVFAGSEHSGPFRRGRPAAPVERVAGGTQHREDEEVDHSGLNSRAALASAS